MANRANWFGKALTASVALWMVLGGFVVESAVAQQSLLERLRGLAGRSEASEPQVEVKLVPSPNGRPGDVLLSVTVRLAPGNYTYSTNPAFGGCTRIRVDRAVGLEPVEPEFRADRPPKVVFEPLFKQNLEKFYDQVTWSRAYRVTASDPKAQLEVSGQIEFQVCDAGSCRQLTRKFRAVTSLAALKLPPRRPRGANAPPQRAQKTSEADWKPSGAAFTQEVLPTVPGTSQAGPVVWTFRLEPRNAAPGQKVILTVTATIREPFYVYAQDQNPKNYGVPTRIVLDQVVGLRPLDPAFVPSDKPEIKLTFDGKEQRIHHGRISWSRRFEVLASAAGRYGVAGTVTYQVCDPRSCRQGKVDFRLGHVPPKPAGQEAGTAAAPGANQKAGEEKDGGRRSGAGRLDLSKLEPQYLGPEKESLWQYILMAFAAGFVLNFMPCVLPVIGLKIMAFVQQAGESRARAFLLNLWFSLGLLSVFLVLATLAVFAGLGWGAQFSNTAFNIVLTSVVFAFALSFLDVWEIPIPGFAGSGKAAELAEREGYFGAFFKGVLTTVLATPCSGPMLVPALTWAVAQPASVTYTVFASVGLGMASPYLLVGAFPKLLFFLPRPGAWMDTFKHIMGFVLLGTVVFLLTFIEVAYVVPTVAFLMGLWAACWWGGRLPLTAPTTQRLKAWAQAAAFTVLVGWVSFGWLHEVMAARLEGRNAEIPWQPYSEELLEKLLLQKKNVFVAFTADW